MTRHIRACDRADASQLSYLGDGVYAAWDGFGVWLTAENGVEATDAIYLEPDVYRSLCRFMDETRRSDQDRDGEEHP